MVASSSSAPSPKRSARSHTLCVTLSTLIFSSYVNEWFWYRSASSRIRTRQLSGARAGSSGRCSRDVPVP